MLLLKYCTFEPTGPSNLAALRFSSPVRIQAITIFPTNYQPFEQNPDIISRTEPEAFFLELYFNAHPVAHPSSKEKPKLTNALVPTIIAYAGGCEQFTVNMSPEFPTRLMIVKGAFDCVSMAIYGDVVSEMPPPSSTYEPKAIPSFDPIPLSNTLDPASFRDPSKLALQLLELIPDAPPLPHVIRLMFCLKPSNDDWDLPEFPYLYANLDEDFELDLEKAWKLTSRPASEDTTHDTFVQFAASVVRSSSNEDESPASLIAAILCHSACQNPDMSNSILESTSSERTWNASNLDASTLRDLIYAAANPDIARSLNVDWFLEAIRDVEGSTIADQATRALASRLLARLEGVVVFEDAISNTQGDFMRATMTLQDIGSQEPSFGTWLVSMITHPDLVDKLSENPTSSPPSQFPALLLKGAAPSVSHDEFISFLRAFIGVSCVLAVYAWADSLPEPKCRERTLSILRLWHGVDGYREILNCLLTLRQMVFRLECMLDNDVPTKAGIDAEHILVNLAKEPKAMLNRDLARCILEMKLVQSFITEEEYESMRAAAIISDDGLPGAIDCLLQPLERPPALKTLRSVRVAFAVVDQELDERGDPEVMEEFWKEGSHSRSLETCLVDILSATTEEVGFHFSVHPPPPAPKEYMAQLFRAADDALKLLSRIMPAYVPPGRVIRTIVCAAADLFVFTDAADMLYSQTSQACIAAQETRQSCIDMVRQLAGAQEPLPGGKPIAEVVLRTLLDHALHSDDHDPSRHLLQVFYLIDLLLPLPSANGDAETWMRRVIPSMLQELWRFARALDTENKAHFVRRLVELDKGIVGIGDWLLGEELKMIESTFRVLEDPGLRPSHRLARRYQVSLSFRFLLELLSSSTDISRWCSDCLATSSEVAQAFAMTLQMFIEQELSSTCLGKIVRTLASAETPVDEVLRLPIVLVILRSCRLLGTSASDLTSSFYLAHTLLLSMSRDVSLEDSVVLELAEVLAAMKSPSILSEGDTADALLGLLEWLSSTGHIMVLPGVAVDKLAEAYAAMKTALAPEKTSTLEAVQRCFVGDASSPSQTLTPLPDTIELSMQDIDDLLRLPTPEPSTPPRKVLNQDVLSLVAISPPALIRSPAATGLTKTYLKNDFRQLRQAPSARQNTSRLPSMHVDDFESASSPTLLTQPLPLPVPMPLSMASASTVQYPTSGETFGTLSPVFKLL